MPRRLPHLVDAFAAVALIVSFPCFAQMSSHDDAFGAGMLAAVSERRSEGMPAPADFSGPRETWQRLSQALRRGDRKAALKELTPAAQERYASTLDDLIKTKPFDEKRFGKVRAVTLSGGRFATVNLTRTKDGATYSSDVMMMREDDGKWRVDRMTP